ncbi:ras-related protein Rab-3-like protein, partial [Dinothrombium tinctorium]
DTSVDNETTTEIADEEIDEQNVMKNILDKLKNEYRNVIDPISVPDRSFAVEYKILFVTLRFEYKLHNCKVYGLSNLHVVEDFEIDDDPDSKNRFLAGKLGVDELRAVCDSFLQILPYTRSSKLIGIAKDIVVEMEIKHDKRTGRLQMTEFKVQDVKELYFQREEGGLLRTISNQMAGGQEQKWQKDAADQNFDYMFKILIIGNSSVGKTSFLFRYADDSFTSAFVSTVGIDFKVKTVFRQDKRVKLQIWDTAGQERYRTITTAYYRGAMGFILMYDVTNEESFNSVQDWVTQIQQYSWDNAQVILVGNKCDMEDERVVSTERGRQLADQLKLEFFESSAKENINVKAVFERLVDIICDRMSESLDSDPTMINASKGTRLTDNPMPQNTGCQC